MLNKVKESLNLIDIVDKKKFHILCFMILIGGLIELVSIASLYQIIKIFSLGTEIKEDPFINGVLKYFNIQNFSQALIFFTLFLLLIFFIKVIFLSCLNFFQNRFIFNLQSNLSKKLFNHYISQNFIFHLDNNSSSILRNLKDDISLFCIGIIQPTMNIILEFFIIILIIGLLIYIEPAVVSSSLIFLLFFALIYFFIIKKKILFLGKSRQEMQTKIIKSIQESIFGIRDVKLLNKERLFINYFGQISDNLSKISTSLVTLQQFPRIGLEFLIVLVFVMLLLSSNINESNYKNLMQIIGLFAIVSLRMLPSINKILVSVQNIRSNIPSLIVIKDILEKKTHDKINKLETNIELNFKKKISIINLKFKYPSDREEIFKNLNFEIKRNQMIGLLGLSGSGKSTLVDLITGLLKPSEGDIKVDDKSIYNNLQAWQSKIGYVSQSIFLLDDTLSKNIAFNLSEKEIDKKKIWHCLEIAELEKFVKNLPEKEQTIVGEKGSKLSGGQVQRIGIARAFYNNPEILIFDEATSALDLNTEENLLKTINKIKSKKTIIIISHRESTVHNCDNVYILENGKIINKKI